MTLKILQRLTRVVYNSLEKHHADHIIILFEQVLLYTGMSDTQKKYYKAILMKDLGKKFLKSLNKITVYQ